MLRSLPIALLFLIGCASAARVEGSLSESREGVMALRWGPAGSGLVHGQGLARGDRFEMEVEGAPPPAAFHQGVAVGEIVLLGQDARVRLGAPLADVRGIATGVALVYRTETLGADTAWASTFRTGLSCALESAEGWRPVECGGLQPLRFD